ncbi:hypothetical protein FHT00_000717 [Sphingomonas insulae]|uniref:Haemolysin-type calcium binding-related domain-containing protein n=1 Tax=Sphingomonas insulae TaxID=424800 RepID=A0ABN1HYY9_9SPHN|nr:calcium-binding protein [Sphingomonas insulae]NIJ28789.1 hypothetical protein [Sphingomonas insulae]
MNTVLQRAILALDAYNRGRPDDVGLRMPTNRVAGAIVSILSTENPAYNSAFAATSYNLVAPGAGTVIAYRGTDHLGGDLFTGYAQGAGGLDPQAIDAINFYNATKQSIANSPGANSSASIVTTGHSLGGGLAGLVSALYGLDSTIFNNMPFQAAAENYNVQAQLAGTVNATQYSQPLKDLIYGSGTVGSIFNNNPVTYSNAHDFLGVFRHLATNVEHELEAGDGPWISTPVLGHSMATQVALVYASTNNLTSWLPASGYLWNAFISTDVAGRVGGLDSYRGTSDRSSALRTIIAYSAVDAGLTSADKPFGDTGIAAMFDDTADMAAAVNGETNSSFTRGVNYIASLAVLNAGNLAVQGVMQAAQSSAVDGVLDRGVNSDVFSIDLTQNRWNIGSSNAPTDYVRAIIDLGLANVSRASDLRSALSAFGKDASNYSDISSISYQTSLTTIGAGPSVPPASVEFTFLADASSGADTTNAPTATVRAIATAISSSQQVIGHDEDDIFLGGLGNDLLIGGGGRNALFGREGNDIISTSGTNDIISGGSGNDLIRLSSGSTATITFGRGDGKDVVRYASGQAGYNLRLDNLSINDISIIVGGSDNSYQAYGDVGSANVQFLVFKIKATGETITLAQQDADIGAVSSTSFQKNGLAYAAAQNPISSVMFKGGITWSASQLWAYIGGHALHGNVTSHMMTSFDRTSGYGFTGQRAKAAKYLHDINEQYFLVDPVKPAPVRIPGTSSPDYIVDDGGDDVIDPGLGDDTVELGAGNDTVLWNINSGKDSVVSLGEYNGSDVIKMGIGVARSNLTYTVDNYGSITIAVAEAGGSLTLQGQYFATSGNGDVSLELADGTQISHAQMMAAAATSIPANHQVISGTNGDDTINLPTFNFTYAGAKGNDTIYAGSSTTSLVGSGGEIRFATGDGNDIFDGGAGRQDGLFLSDSLPSDVSLKAIRPRYYPFSYFGGVVVALPGGDTFTINDQFALASGGQPEGIGAIRFADGTVWDRAAIQSHTAFGPTIMGTPYDEALTLASDYARVDAGKGDDYIAVSGNGGGEIIFRANDGHDILDNPGSGFHRSDTLALQDLNPADVSLMRTGEQMSLTVLATGAVFDAQFQFWEGGRDQGLDFIRFANGAVWNRSDMLSQIASNPTVMGTPYGEALTLASDYVRVDPGKGDDYIAVSGEGGGEIIFRANDGHDILDNPGSGFHRSDTLVLQGLNPADISLKRTGDQMSVTVLATNAVFHAQFQFWQGGQDQGLDFIRFADGTTWDRTRFEQEVVPPATGATYDARPQVLASQLVQAASAFDQSRGAIEFSMSNYNNKGFDTMFFAREAA